MATPKPDTEHAGFAALRRDVLASPWLDSFDADEAAAFVALLPRGCFASEVYQMRPDEVLLQPRGGIGTFSAEQALVKALDAAGADFIPLTIDSHSRHGDYESAAAFLARSLSEGREFLNGYPLVNHGHRLTRTLFAGIEKPVSLRHGTPDPRLLAEVALASGITEIEGGGLCYTLPYHRNFPLDSALLCWRYVDRLCARYSRPGRVIHRESFGPLTATQVPPVIVVCIQLLELLLAAEQGVKSFAISFGQSGSVDQDLAIGRCLRARSAHYLNAFGFADVSVRLVYHQWMGAFPQDKHLSDALIVSATMIAQALHADKMVVKTRSEAFGLPSAEVNAQALQMVRYVLETNPILSSLGSPAVDEELSLITSEVEHLMDAVFDAPGASLWECVHHAVLHGLIDVPFSPHSSNANKLLVLRGPGNALRISEPGNLPMRAADLRAERRLLQAVSAQAPVHRRLLRDIQLMQGESN